MGYWWKGGLWLKVLSGEFSKHSTQLTSFAPIKISRLCVVKTSGKFPNIYGSPSEMAMEYHSWAMMFDCSSCDDWQGIRCYGCYYTALMSEINVVIRASLSLTLAGLQLWTVIVKCSLDSILAATHKQLNIYLQQSAKMNPKLRLW